MTTPRDASAEAVAAVLDAVGDAAIAVSGGVDSTTLAVLAHRRRPAAITVFHAISPAVPPEATDRVERLAATEGWRLRVVDAGEFADPAYLANPADRCRHCKTHLYATICRETAAAVLSGTNLDDLRDIRPGLDAAARHGVRHPYVEAGVNKAGVRAIARALGLTDLAELPASPCLSSRIETGIPVRAGALALVHAIEQEAAAGLRATGVRPEAVRCRVRRSGLVLELDEASFAALRGRNGDALRARLAATAGAAGAATDLRVEPYRKGSAFLRSAAGGDGA